MPRKLKPRSPGFPCTKPDQPGRKRIAYCYACSRESIQSLRGAGSWITCPDCKTVFLIHEHTTEDTRDP